MPKVPTLDRVESLLLDRFPGFSKEVRAVVAKFKAWDHPLTDNVAHRLLEVAKSQDWDLCEFSTEAGASRGVDELTKESVAAWLERADRYEDELDDLTEDELASRFAVLVEAQQVKNRAKGLAHDRERFFNGPAAGADFAYWCSVPLWAPEEAVALSLGKDPNVVNRATLADLAPDTSPFASEFHRRLTVVQRSIEAKNLAERVAPAMLVEMMIELGWKFPSQFPDMAQRPNGESEQAVALEARIAELEGQLALLASNQAKYLTPTDQMASKRPATLYAIIRGLAINRFGWPNAPKVVAKMISSLDLAGVSISDDTLSDVLADAERWSDGKPKSDPRFPKS